MRTDFNKVAVIAVSEAGSTTAQRLLSGGLTADLYLPAGVMADTPEPVVRFNKGIHSLTEIVFPVYDGLVYVMPSGIVVRAIAPHIKDKHCDPAVVTVDVEGRWAIATLSGHEGGANMLASRVAGMLHGEPVITTSTEAVKTLIAGVGCGKGVPETAIADAVEDACAKASCSTETLRLVATVDAKKHEAGLVAFCENRNLPLRIISREAIRSMNIRCGESAFVKKTLGVGAVAQPCALLGGSKTELLLEKQVYRRITVALAVEHPEW
jgi:cobalt-precorrin 5A hydrolase